MTLMGTALAQGHSLRDVSRGPKAGEIDQTCSTRGMLRSIACRALFFAGALCAGGRDPWSPRRGAARAHDHGAAGQSPRPWAAVAAPDRETPG